MRSKLHQSRRSFFVRAGFAATGLWVEQRTLAAQGSKPEEVSPSEDLMREHGVLKRVLLIYEDCTRRLDTKNDAPPDSVRNAARIIRDFIENYHEKLEENFLFPRFRKANQQNELVDVLTQQHQAGRKLTDTVITLATLQTLK